MVHTYSTVWRALVYLVHYFGMGCNLTGHHTRRSLWIDTNVYSGSESAFTFLPGNELFVLFIHLDIVETLWHFYDSRNTEVMFLIWMIVSTIYWTSVILVFNRWANRCAKAKLKAFCQWGHRWMDTHNYLSYIYIYIMLVYVILFIYLKMDSGFEKTLLHCTCYQ